MTEAQRVGQLLMVGAPSAGLSADTTAAIRDDDAGSVILIDTSARGVDAIRSLTQQLQSEAPRHDRLFIATDQEGGLVQRMQGPGFSTIPSAVEQGKLASDTLRQEAQNWGTQLAAAGLNVDLAPVLDTVPRGDTDNPPIGDLEREYGHTPDAVSTSGLAFAEGLNDAHVAATVKHFPGLGRVTGNTDTVAGVTDDQTTAHDPYLKPFAGAVRANVPFVMVSTAIYSKIDRGVPAAFSRKIVTGILRDRFGFGGVIITDDLGGAAQVSSYSVAQRAIKVIAAGGDMLLTIVPTQAATMTSALLVKAKRDATFKAKIDAAALRVLEVKQRFGLLS